MQKQDVLPLLMEHESELEKKRKHGKRDELAAATEFDVQMSTVCQASRLFDLNQLTRLVANDLVPTGSNQTIKLGVVA